MEEQKDMPLTENTEVKKAGMMEYRKNGYIRVSQKQKVHRNN
jgi:hypothetical protein